MKHLISFMMFTFTELMETLIELDHQKYYKEPLLNDSMYLYRKKVVFNHVTCLSVDLIGNRLWSWTIQFCPQFREIFIIILQCLICKCFSSSGIA